VAPLILSLLPEIFSSPYVINEGMIHMEKKEKEKIIKKKRKRKRKRSKVDCP
jgi:hypothetical protein